MFVSSLRELHPFFPFNWVSFLVLDGSVCQTVPTEQETILAVTNPVTDNILDVCKRLG